MSSQSIIYTNKAKCRDCYRCLRACPVKAIRMQQNQASVEDSLCIACGTCIKECPQGAKNFRSDLTAAQDLLQKNTFVAASIAPSIAALYSDWELKRLPSALRQLGFQYIGQTALGAELTAQATAEKFNKASNDNKQLICSACPAVVNYIEKYSPELISYLAPVLSPMAAHASLLKQQLDSETKIIFIGPCIAKKTEAERPQLAGLVDIVLTFQELQTWFKEADIQLANCEESNFNDNYHGQARLFPLAGGLAKTAQLETDLLSTQVAAVSGYKEIKAIFGQILQKKEGGLIEPLFCEQGCINGPGFSQEQNLFERRTQILSFNNTNTGAENPISDLAKNIDCTTNFKQQESPILAKKISEEDIRLILAKTGKTQPADELNCGSCGYLSCREKAIAIIRNMAELEMCMPFMRKLAERRTDRIIETSPNGIIILDDKLEIISMNPAFKRLFLCSDAILGKPISYLIDPEPFETLKNQEVELVERTVNYKSYSLICRQLCYFLAEENQFVGIFVNITKLQESKKELEIIREKTIEEAKNLLHHQVTMAQKMAKFLGEHTAIGEELVENLMRFVETKKNSNFDDLPPL